ncbi:hypothetical protein C8R44DRAFT_880238 [Mycena epipterygia]|nr:hypothetical protein C8R44DRAFT_880238 [Mycena epipterygia]
MNLNVTRDSFNPPTCAHRARPNCEQLKDESRSRSTRPRCLLYYPASTIYPTPTNNDPVDATLRPLNFGCLGAANIAPGAIVKPSRTHPEVILYAVAARNPKRADAFAKEHGFERKSNMSEKGNHALASVHKHHNSLLHFLLIPPQKAPQPSPPFLRIVTQESPRYYHDLKSPTFAFRRDRALGHSPPIPVVTHVPPRRYGLSRCGPMVIVPKVRLLHSAAALLALRHSTPALQRCSVSQLHHTPSPARFGASVSPSTPLSDEGATTPASVFGNRNATIALAATSSPTATMRRTGRTMETRGEAVQIEGREPATTNGSQGISISVKGLRRLVLQIFAGLGPRILTTGGIYARSAAEPMHKRKKTAHDNEDAENGGLLPNEAPRPPPAPPPVTERPSPLSFLNHMHLDPKPCPLPRAVHVASDPELRVLQKWPRIVVPETRATSGPLRNRMCSDPWRVYDATAAEVNEAEDVYWGAWTQVPLGLWFPLRLAPAVTVHKSQEGFDALEGQAVSAPVVLACRVDYLRVKCSAHFNHQHRFCAGAGAY